VIFSSAPATRVFGTPVVQGDVDGNGAADGLDVARFVHAALGAPVSPGDVGRADLNCDEVINQLDVTAFLNAPLN